MKAAAKMSLASCQLKMKKNISKSLGKHHVTFIAFELVMDTGHRLTEYSTDDVTFEYPIG